MAISENGMLLISNVDPWQIRCSDVSIYYVSRINQAPACGFSYYLSRVTGLRLYSENGGRFSAYAR